MLITQADIDDFVAAKVSAIKDFHNQDMDGLRALFTDPDEAVTVFKAVMNDPATIQVMAAIGGDIFALASSEGKNFFAAGDIIMQNITLHQIIEKAKGGVV